MSKEVFNGQADDTLVYWETYLPAWRRWKPIIGMAPSNSDSGWFDQFAWRVKVAKTKVIEVTKIWCRVFQFTDFVVILNNWFEYIRKHLIGFRISSVDTCMTAQMQATCERKRVLIYECTDPEGFVRVGPTGSTTLMSFLY